MLYHRPIVETLHMYIMSEETTESIHIYTYIHIYIHAYVCIYIYIYVDVFTPL